MELSEIGKMAYKYWYEIPSHSRFVRLGVIVLMPNHVHGIIIIDKNDDGNTVAKTQNVSIVETQNIASLHLQQLYQNQQIQSIKSTDCPINQFGRQSKNLASIVRGYKIGVTKNARKINPYFCWQLHYYEHIIRDEKSYFKIEGTFNQSIQIALRQITTKYLIHKFTIYNT